MKKVLLPVLGAVVLSATIYGTHKLSTPKIYQDKDVKCDFDIGMCYDHNNKPITGRIQNFNNSTLISDIEYKDGKENGLLKIYRTDGTLYLKGTYKNGLPDGYVKEYNQDGTLFSYDEFKDGLQHGKSIIYQAQNKILKQWHYDNGKETGIGTVYYPNDKTQLEVNHNTGELKYYNEDGTLQTLAHFNSNGYHGTWQNYTKDGKITLELVYKDGKPQSGYCLDKNSQKKEFTPNDFTIFATTNKTPCDETIADTQKK